MTIIQTTQEQVNIISFALNFNKGRDRQRLFPKDLLKVLGRLFNELHPYEKGEKFDKICPLKLDKEMRNVIQFCLDDHEWLVADAHPVMDLELKLKTVK